MNHIVFYLHLHNMLIHINGSKPDDYVSPTAIIIRKCIHWMYNWLITYHKLTALRNERPLIPIHWILMLLRIYMSADHTHFRPHHMQILLVGPARVIFWIELIFHQLHALKLNASSVQPIIWNWTFEPINGKHNLSEKKIHHSPVRWKQPQSLRQL